jgi:hypothetical protein
MGVDVSVAVRAGVSVGAAIVGVSSVEVSGVSVAGGNVSEEEDAGVTVAGMRVALDARLQETESRTRAPRSLRILIICFVLDIDESMFQMIIVVNCQRALISLAVPTTAVSP